MPKVDVTSHVVETLILCVVCACTNGISNVYFKVKGKVLMHKKNDLILTKQKMALGAKCFFPQFLFWCHV